MTQVPNPRVHNYLSTHCWHDDCPNCRLECKTCQAPCRCRCHVFAQGIEKPVSAPTVATPPVEPATEPAAASNEVHRKALERIAREVVLAREYTAPIVVALDTADAIQAAGWRPPAPQRTAGPNHICPPDRFDQAPPGVRFYVGYIAELDDDSEGPQFMEFSGTTFADEAAAREELADAQAWRPGWHLYRLTDITERPSE